MISRHFQHMASAQPSVLVGNREGKVGEGNVALQYTSIPGLSTLFMNPTTHPTSSRPPPHLMYVTFLLSPAFLFQVLLPSLNA